MAYNRRSAGSGPATLGVAEVVLDLSNDVAIGDDVKTIEVKAAGTLKYVPIDSDDVITVTDAPAGYQPPVHVKTVKSTANGTTATVSQVLG